MIENYTINGGFMNENQNIFIQDEEIQEEKMRILRIS
jgi:hypothetical protein